MKEVQVQVQGSVLQNQSRLDLYVFSSTSTHTPPSGLALASVGLGDSGECPKFLRMGLFLFLTVLENLERAQAETATRGVDCSEIYTQTADPRSEAFTIHFLWAGNSFLLRRPGQKLSVFWCS